MKNLLMVACLLICLFSYSQNSGAFKIIYEADENGNAISGNFKELISYANSGNPIRVGWTLSAGIGDSIFFLTHWTEANFITISELVI